MWYSETLNRWTDENEFPGGPGTETVQETTAPETNLEWDPPAPEPYQEPTQQPEPPLPPEPPAFDRYNMDPKQSDPRHVYVGRDSRGDVWQLIDEGGNVIEWAVAAGDYSGNVVAGTIRNLKAPSANTIAQGPGPAPIGDTIPDDPKHRYAGTAPNGDRYQLTDDGGNVIQWVVPFGADSRQIIPSTIQNLGKPAGSTETPPPIAPTLPPLPFIADAGTVLLNPSPTPPKQSDPRHKYVVRDSRGDVWQLFDGANVLEWAVKRGDLSGNVIAGTVKNLGAPSSMTVAQDDGYRENPGPVVTAFPAPTATAAAGDKSTILVLLGIAASVAGVFK